MICKIIKLKFNVYSIFGTAKLELVTTSYDQLDSSDPKDIELTDVATPTVALTRDTGNSGTDKITSDAQITVGGITQGATWEYKIEGESSFTTGTGTTILASAFGSDGRKTVAVRQIVSGSHSVEKNLAFTLDSTKPIITVDEDFIILAQNSQAPDLLEGVDIIDDDSTIAITRTGAVTVSNIGEYIINYDATDLAGNVAARKSRTYSVADPLSLTVIIRSTTVATDGITNSPTISYTATFSKSVSDFEIEDITVSGTANGNDLPEVSNFAGSGKAYTFDVERGSSDGTIIVFIAENMVTDTTDGSSVAPIFPSKNMASNTYTVTIDTALPVTPTVELTDDTGIAIDSITNDARISVGTLEEGATWEYKVEGESSFTIGAGTTILASTFGSDGEKTVAVRQRDVAGNYSAEASFSFTLDTTAPDKPIITTQTAISLVTPFEFEGTTDEDTTVKLFRGNTLLGTATVTNNTNWTLNAALIDGENLITAQATDVAGNISVLSDVFTITGYLNDNAVFWDGNSWSGGSGTDNAPNSDDEAKALIIDSPTSATLSTSVKVNSLWVKQGSKLIVEDSLYLKVTNSIRLDGELRMIGKSQLVQTHAGGSMINMASTSNMYKDQEGVATTTYQYNYWSSPVREVGSQTFSIASVMRDGTIPTSADSNPGEITFVDAQNGNTDNSIVSISNNWIYSYINGLFPSTDNTSSRVKRSETHNFNPGEGFTLKGPGGGLQNYTFRGIPNDGDITTTITGYGSNSDGKYFSLLGNPYPSALDGVKFLEQNIVKIDGLYLWDQKENLGSHTHSEHTGGYATINIAMGVAAPTLTAASEGIEYKEPTRYIPVGQGFFVRGTQVGGTITFNPHYSSKNRNNVCKALSLSN